MGIASVFYVVSGYLALLAAILWGMVFLGDSSILPNLDTARNVAPPLAAFIDVGALSLLAVLVRSASRGRLRHFLRRLAPHRLERATQAWAAAAMLGLTYLAWQPLPQILWNVNVALQGALGLVFCLAWMALLVAVFLAFQLDVFDSVEAGSARSTGKEAVSLSIYQPLACAVLVAVWATPLMTAGHLLLATAVLACVIGGVRAPVKIGTEQHLRPAFSLQRKRVVR